MLNDVFILHHVKLIDFTISLIIEFTFAYVPHDDGILKLKCLLYIQNMPISRVDIFPVENQVEELFIYHYFYMLPSDSFDVFHLVNVLLLILVFHRLQLTTTLGFVEKFKVNVYIVDDLVYH